MSKFHLQNFKIVNDSRQKYVFRFYFFDASIDNFSAVWTSMATLDYINYNYSENARPDIV